MYSAVVLRDIPFKNLIEKQQLKFVQNQLDLIQAKNMLTNYRMIWKKVWFSELEILGVCIKM